MINKGATFNSEDEMFINIVYRQAPDASLEELQRMFPHVDQEQLAGQYLAKKKYPTEESYRQYLNNAVKEGSEDVMEVLDKLPSFPIE